MKEHKISFHTLIHPPVSHSFLWFPATTSAPLQNSSVCVQNRTVFWQSHTTSANDLTASCVSVNLLSFPGFKRPLCPLLRPQRPAGRAQECGVCDRHQRLHAGEKDQTGKAAQSVDVYTSCMNVLELLYYLNILWGDIKCRGCSKWSQYLLLYKVYT